MFCSECGKEIRDDATLCPYCGFTVNPKAQETQKKFCTHCGTEVKDDMQFCSQCGRKLKSNRFIVDDKTKMVLQIIAKVLMVIACVRAAVFICYSGFVALSLTNLEHVMAFWVKLVDWYDIIDLLNVINLNYQVLFSVSALSHAASLFWLIPMTVYYFRAIAKNQSVGLGFKICTIIFVSPLTGILMLCCDINQNR